MIFFFRIQFYSRNCISYFFYLNILLFLVQIRGLAESSNNQPGSAAGATHSEIFSFNSSMGALPLVSPLLSSVRQHQATVSVCLVFFLLFFLVFFLVLLLLFFFFSINNNINKVRAPRIRSAHIPADLYFCGQP